VGVVLVPALALELVLRKRRLTRELLYLLIIPMGMLVYFLYLQLAFGNFWLFFKAQASSVPIRHLSPWLWEPITHQLPVLFGNPFVPKFVIGWIEVLSVLAAFVCGALVWKRWRPSYGLYTTLAVIPPLSSCSSRSSCCWEDADPNGPGSAIGCWSRPCCCRSSPFCSPALPS
jgi:hypothetical protein